MPSTTPAFSIASGHFDVIEGDALSADFTVYKPLSGDFTIAVAISSNFTIEPNAGVDMSGEFTVARPLSSNVTVGRTLSGNFTVGLPLPLSADFTVYKPLSSNFTIASAPMSGDFTVSRPLSGDFTVFPYMAMSGNFTVKPAPLYSVTGPSSVGTGVAGTYVAYLDSGYTGGSVVVTPAFNTTGTFSPTSFTLSSATPVVYFTLTSSSNGNWTISFTHTGPSGPEADSILVEISPSPSAPYAKAWAADLERGRVTLAWVSPDNTLWASASGRFGGDIKDGTKEWSTSQVTGGVTVWGEQLDTRATDVSVCMHRESGLAQLWYTHVPGTSSLSGVTPHSYGLQTLRMDNAAGGAGGLWTPPVTVAHRDLPYLPFTEPWQPRPAYNDTLGFYQPFYVTSPSRPNRIFAPQFLKGDDGRTYLVGADGCYNPGRGTADGWKPLPGTLDSPGIFNTNDEAHRVVSGPIGVDSRVDRCVQSYFKVVGVPIAASAIVRDEHDALYQLVYTRQYSRVRKMEWADPNRTIPKGVGCEGAMGQLSNNAGSTEPPADTTNVIKVKYNVTFPTEIATATRALFGIGRVQRQAPLLVGDWSEDSSGQSVLTQDGAKTGRIHFQVPYRHDIHAAMSGAYFNGTYRYLGVRVWVKAIVTKPKDFCIHFGPKKQDDPFYNAGTGYENQFPLENWWPIGSGQYRNKASRPYGDLRIQRPGTWDMEHGYLPVVLGGSFQNNQPSNDGNLAILDNARGSSYSLPYQIEGTYDSLKLEVRLEVLKTASYVNPFRLPGIPPPYDMTDYTQPNMAYTIESDVEADNAIASLTNENLSLSSDMQVQMVFTAAAGATPDDNLLAKFHSSGGTALALDLVFRQLPNALVPVFESSPLYEAMCVLTYTTALPDFYLVRSYDHGVTWEYGNDGKPIQALSALRDYNRANGGQEVMPVLLGERATVYALWVTANKAGYGQPRVLSTSDGGWNWKGG